MKTILLNVEKTVEKINDFIDYIFVKKHMIDINNLQIT